MTLNHWCFSRSMKDVKMKHLVIMALHYYLHNGNPCHVNIIRMRIVLQSSIDSGTIFFFFLQFDRGWPLLSSAGRSPPTLPLPNFYPASDRLSRTHHHMIFILFSRCEFTSLARWFSWSPCRRSWSRRLSRGKPPSQDKPPKSSDYPGYDLIYTHFNARMFS